MPAGSTVPQGDHLNAKVLQRLERRQAQQHTRLVQQLPVCRQPAVGRCRRIQSVSVDAEPPQQSHPAGMGIQDQPLVAQMLEPLIHPWG